MKKILIIALTLIAFNTANAETPATATKEATQTTTPVKAVEVKESNDNATAVGAPDNSARFVGTNDLNLYILREGVKKA